MCFWGISQQANAQLLKRIKDKAVQTAEDKLIRKTGETTEKAMDKAEDGIKSNNKGTASAIESNEDESSSNNKKAPAEKNNKNEPIFQANSKFDFVPGETTIFYEDFAPDAVGDFPARWNTNVSGEVVTVNTAPGKWFKLKEGGGFIPDGVSQLPDNFTVEFDVILKHNDEMNPGGFYLDITDGQAQNKLDDLYPGKSGVRLYIDPRVYRVMNFNEGDFGKISSNVDNDVIYKNQGQSVRVSVWRQKQRIRLYVNEAKLFDLPRVLPENTSINMIRFSTWDTGLDPQEDALVSNFRVAIGDPDMRSKLITEGKLVTQGILFDVNSDKIKPESAGTLKSIADVLKENANVKVQIIGHTDSDGDDAANLALSKKRSASVKNALSTAYGIDSSRMETDGLGESKPIAENTTSEGKAKNRRVEFVKL
jgi:outer membrane protein OmpA-like peptidoglycan-associated protein